MSDPREPDEVETVRDAVLAVPGVVDLHAGMFGEAATYLPGRKVAGIRRTAEGMEVHVALAYGIDARTTANQVRLAVAALADGAVDVIVEDIVPSPTGS